MCCWLWRGLSPSSRSALDWFTRIASDAFATCPLTQTGFVRISSNPTLTSSAVRPPEALRLLDRITALKNHVFLPDDATLAETIVNPLRFIGHRQVIDAYLIGLARRHDGVVATLDKGLIALAGDERNLIELV